MWCDWGAACCHSHPAASSAAAGADASRALRASQRPMAQALAAASCRQLLALALLLMLAVMSPLPLLLLLLRLAVLLPQPGEPQSSRTPPETLLSTCPSLSAAVGRHRRRCCACEAAAYTACAAALATPDSASRRIQSDAASACNTCSSNSDPVRCKKEAAPSPLAGLGNDSTTGGHCSALPPAVLFPHPLGEPPAAQCQLARTSRKWSCRSGRPRAVAASLSDSGNARRASALPQRSSSAVAGPVCKGKWK